LNVSRPAISSTARCMAVMAADGSGFGHVADAAADEALGRLGVRVAKRLHAPADFRKQVAGFELEIIVVKKCHIEMFLIVILIVILIERKD